MLPLCVADVVPSNTHIEVVQQGFQLLQGKCVLLSVPLEEVLQEGGCRDGRRRRGCCASPDAAAQTQQQQEQQEGAPPKTRVPKHGREAEKTSTRAWITGRDAGSSSE